LQTLIERKNNVVPKDTGVTGSVLCSVNVLLRLGFPSYYCDSITFSSSPLFVLFSWARSFQTQEAARQCRLVQHPAQKAMISGGLFAPYLKTTHNFIFKDIQREKNHSE